eukprot:14849019-Ditylum_brightwellii.AAC.1
MFELATILTVLEYSTEESKTVRETIGNICRIMTLTKETLELNADMSAGVIGEIMCLKDWYIQWRKTDEVKTGVKASEVFTLEMWEDFIQERAKRQENAPIIVKHEQGVAAPAALTTSIASGGLNVSYQVETKEIPKLPVNKLHEGKVFDDWNSSFLSRCAKPSYKIHLKIDM